MAEAIFMKFGKNIMAPLPISTVYLKIPSISLCVYMCIPQWFSGNGWIKTLPRQRTHMQQ
jgi:hypothetical protein